VRAVEPHPGQPGPAGADHRSDRGRSRSSAGAWAPTQPPCPPPRRHLLTSPPARRPPSSQSAAAPCSSSPPARASPCGSTRSSSSSTRPPLAVGRCTRGRDHPPRSSTQQPRQRPRQQRHRRPPQQRPGLLVVLRDSLLWQKTVRGPVGEECALLLPSPYTPSSPVPTTAPRQAPPHHFPALSLYTHTSSRPTNAAVYHFCRGIGADSATGTILVGTSWGDLLTVNVAGTPSTQAAFTTGSPLRGGHRHPVNAVAAAAG
jgi:hypothetical protein